MLVSSVSDSLSRAGPGVQLKFLMTGLLNGISSHISVVRMCPPLTNKNWDIYEPILALGSFVCLWFALYHTVVNICLCFKLFWTEPWKRDCVFAAGQILQADLIDTMIRITDKYRKKIIKTVVLSFFFLLNFIQCFFLLIIISISYLLLLFCHWLFVAALIPFFPPEYKDLLYQLSVELHMWNSFLPVCPVTNSCGNWLQWISQRRWPLKLWQTWIFQALTRAQCSLPMLPVVR